MKVEHLPSLRGAEGVQDSLEDFYEKECDYEMKFTIPKIQAEREKFLRAN